jgi:hypothetical protein
MELKGSIADQGTGTPLANVTIWEIDNDGQAANVIGFSDSQGNYDVQVDDPTSTINYVVDGYTGTAIPYSQASSSDQILLAKDGSLTAKLTISNVPAWLWLLAGITFVWFIGDGKKTKK